MRAKDRKWLEQIKQLSASYGGMYPGMTHDRLPPSVAQRLGHLIEIYIPHNLAHKDRWVITQAGLDALGAPHP